MAGKRKVKSSSTSTSASRSSKRTKNGQTTEQKVEEGEEEEVFEIEDSEIKVEEVELSEDPSPVSSSRRSDSARKQPKRPLDRKVDDEESRLIGEPVPADEARRRWPHRYLDNKKGIEAISEALKGTEEENLTTQARRHFVQAEVDGRILFNLGDDGHVMEINGELFIRCEGSYHPPKAGEGEPSFICRIVEMFEGTDGSPYFTAQWFYRAKDTVIQACSDLIDSKRVFLSKIKDDNPLDCLIEKLRIVRLPLNVDPAIKTAAVSDCDYYYDMLYLVPYSSFLNLPPDNAGDCESESTISSEADVIGTSNKGCEVQENKISETTMLDLYSGCGAMSTGLCLGANMSGVNLVTKWAVDLNPYACASLKLNHPETEVRNESAEDFLMLLKEWEKLCLSYSLIGTSDSQQSVDPVSCKEEEEEEEDEDDGGNDDSEVFEVEEVLSICYGDPKETNKRGLYLKIRWKGYGPDEDTWEPIDGLSDCAEKIRAFVVNGYKSRILPLPGQVDVICGGPPCQGISGFNRFRKKDKPLDDEKNKQLIVYMDVVEHLKPKLVLMENVVDIVKFAKGFLGRYALGRLVGMNYQARIGLMAAGAYGLPQFRMRMFMWGARPTEKLPQYPLPTHDVVVRGGSPVEFESNTVAYDDCSVVELEKKLFLEDAISDLPPVENDETRDEMPYHEDPKTEFQQFIRLRKDEMPGCTALDSEPSKHLLYDHRPLKLNDDDHQRVCQIPKRKGANFRDLTGVKVGENNVVYWDPEVPRVYLPSGKPLVPDYAMTFIDGRSSKPFGRLWWDETVPTVVTRAEPHNQTILHPVQNRVLSIRENARLQGFPDYYKLLGPLKERYIQVGNAVAVPVARALGYSLGLAYKGSSTGEEPLLTLPRKFPLMVGDRLSPSLDEENQ